LRCHDDPPEVPTREAMRLIDAEPVLDAGSHALGKWISGYYCAPLGEVLRDHRRRPRRGRLGAAAALHGGGRCPHVMYSELSPAAQDRNLALYAWHGDHLVAPGGIDAVTIVLTWNSRSAFRLRNCPKGFG